MSTLVDRKADSPARTPWYLTAAPARPSIRTITIATLASALGLLALAALTELSGEAFLIPPLAASMALIVGAPKLPLAQPRNVIGGQMVSAAVGALVALVGDSLWLAAVAGALALGAMLLCRVPHSPAAATAVIGVVTTVPGWQFVLLAGAASLVLVVIGIVGNRLNGASDYPIYYW